MRKVLLLNIELVGTCHHRKNYLQGDQNCCLGVSHIKTTPFVQKKSCWGPQDTQGH